MKDQVTDISYAATKTVIYKYHSAIKNFSKEELEKLFLGFGVLKTVARNTFLFPFDLDLCNDMKTIEQSLLLNSGLQEKYGIDDKLILQKYQEYNGFEFEKLLYETDLLDLELVEKFRFNEINHQSKM